MSNRQQHIVNYGDLILRIIIHSQDIHLLMDNHYEIITDIIALLLLFPSFQRCGGSHMIIT